MNENRELMIDYDDWTPWDGNYAKQMYDIKTSEGEIVKQVYPNGGYMNETRGIGRQWSVEDNILVRVSDEQPF